MTYSQKLRDPRWQKKRLQILERDGWKCTVCSDDRSNLQVHHLVYRKIDPWEYADRCYQTLCESCHEIRQELTDKIVDAIRLRLKDKSTEDLKKMAIREMAVAMSEEEAEASYLHQTLDQALEQTASEKGVISQNLWTDAIADLMLVQLFGKDELRVLNRAKCSIGQALGIISMCAEHKESHNGH